MKIFAKRTNKTKSAAETVTALSDADRTVLDLLKKDPSEWNAKQRRMIKRYQDRIADEQEVPIAKEGVPVEDNDDAAEAVEREKLAEKDDKENTDEDDKDNRNDSSVPPESIDSEQVEPSNDTKLSQNSAEDKVTLESTSPVAYNDTEIDEEKVRQLLDQLNSKNKRKLTRQLEREGNAALAIVREEALKYIEESSKPPAAPAPVVPVVMEENKSKKRKAPADWSGLKPEERLRREEQRKKQQEAAKRRLETSNNNESSSSTKGHKHPLNSERRRANRRKPKWSRKESEKQHPKPINEHDTSGYHMRRITKHS